MSATETTNQDRDVSGAALRLLAAQLCDAGQGVHPAPPRPCLVRDDRDDPGDAVVAVRFAINTTPRHLPTAVLMQEDTDLARSMLKAMENTSYFRFTREVHSVAEFDDLLQSGKVLFGVEIPRGFERAVRRGDKPALLVAADATDPVAAGSALGSLGVHRADRIGARPPHRRSARDAVRDRAHARYNPAASSRLNIVPGLVGTILTMTMLIFTALSVTREIERGTMESLLSMPIRPVEVMFGKIIPYVIVGFIQATLIIGIGVLLFGVPILGSVTLLALF